LGQPRGCPSLCKDNSIMIDVRFSIQKTGACFLCKNFVGCGILKTIEKTIKDMNISSNNDNKMDIVIYRCPEFEEKL
jgi:hypothetical protein